MSFLTFLITLILLLPAVPTYADCNPVDKQSLLSFATNFPTLNWSPTVDCCSWSGVSCDRKTNRSVVGLSLPGRGLSGYLPNPLPSTLRSVNLSSNLFTGSIPQSICNTSPALLILDFSLNNLTGTIPYGFSACSNLRVLSLGFNSLTGKIPVDIKSVLSLKHLSLPGNSLSGEIDEGVTNLTNLKSLVLFGNLFTGSIPYSIGKLTLLENLQLHINRLTGTLPPSLTNCTKLRLLNLRVNSLHGRLSDFDFSGFTQLAIVDLGDNRFTGGLPESLFSCKSLIAIRLATNRLSGEILEQVLDLPSLSFLSLSNNTFKNVSLALDILSRHKTLTTLTLSKNFFNETLPFAGISGFLHLKTIGLGGCKLFGRIPVWLMSLKNLQVIDLSYNNFNGRIPGWLQSLPNLFYLDLSKNSLSGGFPIELTRLPALTASQNGLDHPVNKYSYFELPIFVAPQNALFLQYNRPAGLPTAIYLASNKLTGDIPVEIGGLRAVQVIDLSENYFSGTIPGSISNLKNLEKLDLSHNRLSGEIPSSLKGLNFLSFFDVADNNLQGLIPTGGQFDTFSVWSYEGNPGLCGSPVQRACTIKGSDDPAEKGLNKELIAGPILGFCFGLVITFTYQALWKLPKRRVLPRAIHSYEHDMMTTFNSMSAID